MPLLDNHKHARTRRTLILRLRRHGNQEAPRDELYCNLDPVSSLEKQ